MKFKIGNPRNHAFQNAKFGGVPDAKGATSESLNSKVESNKEEEQEERATSGTSGTLATHVRAKKERKKGAQGAQRESNKCPARNQAQTEVQERKVHLRVFLLRLAYRGTSLIRNCPTLGPNSRHMSRALWLS